MGYGVRSNRFCKISAAASQKGEYRSDTASLLSRVSSKCRPESLSPTALDVSTSGSALDIISGETLPGRNFRPEAEHDCTLRAENLPAELSAGANASVRHTTACNTTRLRQNRTSQSLAEADYGDYQHRYEPQHLRRQHVFGLAPVLVQHFHKTGRIDFAMCPILLKFGTQYIASFQHFGAIVSNPSQ
eukprot:2591481-Rhodomonas_salina.3